MPRYARAMTIPSAPADPLGDALHLMRMSGAFYCRARFSAPWALRLPPFEQSLMFHVLTAGRCTLSVEGAGSCVLQRGDLALVPHGRGHVLSSAPDVAAVNLFDLPRQQLSDRYERLQHGGGGDVTSMICGAVRFDDPAARRLVQALPPVITVHSRDAPRLEWLQSTVRLLALEARDLRPGGDAVISRLADVLVIHAIRSWIEHDPGADTGWLGALRDAHIGRALALIHREPARPWTVADLAASVAMSRSAFAARFAALIGEPVMQYVTRWRMHLALVWLQQDNAPLAEIAGRLGYESDAAFSRSFKRVIGTSPGSVRRRPPSTALAPRGRSQPR